MWLKMSPEILDHYRYTMATNWQYFTEWAISPFRLNRITGTQHFGYMLTENNSIQYGPICMATELRGSMVFPLLFEIMRIEMAKRHPIGLTFINQINKRSYQAHLKRLNMIVVDKFEFNNQNYYGLAFDTNKSVL